MAKKFIEEKKEVGMCYIGPTIPRVAQSNTVYKNGLPSQLEQWMEKYPVFRSLLVPVTGIVEVRREIREIGSEKNLVYQEAKKIIIGGE